MYYLIFIVLMLIVILFLKHQTKLNNDETEKFINRTHTRNMKELSKKPFIWIYIEENINSKNWDDFYSRLKKGNISNYIWLCIYSVYVNCFKDFNIILLNSDNIYQYLPKLKINMDFNSTIDLKKRKQYISFCLLETYGGIYIESNVIVMKNLIDVYNQTDKYDFIGFACPLKYYKSYEKEITPTMDIMISRKNSIVTRLCKIELNKIINSFNYTSYNFNNYGDCVLQKYLKLSIDNYKLNFLQLSPDYNGILDNNKKIINTEYLLSKNKIKFLNEEKVHVFIINKNEITQNFKYNWFDRFSIEQILKSNLWINYLIKKSIKIKDFTNLKESDIINNGTINLSSMLNNCYYFNHPIWLKV